jgi:aminoglycoside phosphotransferase (APT) family kinase protein
MEDVAGRHGPQLRLEDYEVIARDLATTQGAYAAGTTPLPDHDWLSRGWLRGWVEVAGRHVDVIEDGDVWLDERIGSLVPLRKRALELWRERERLLAIVDEAPRTVVHLDFWPTNLFVADGEPTVAIDWSQVGIGALAQDLDQIVLDPIWMHVLPDVDPRMLERHVVHAYTAGLQEAGCDVAIADVHRWYAAAGSVHYTPMLGFQAAAVADADAVAFQERRWGRTFGQITATRGAALQRAIELGEQVLA